MSFAVDYTLAQSPAFQQQVQMALIATALTVMANSVSDPAIQKKRQALGVVVLNAPSEYLTRFVYAAIEEGTLVSGSADATVLAAIGNCWNFVAGVLSTD